ncbi:MAG: hypothetical protein ACE5OV_00705 [Candidatus Bathyarchaeia archaeon]
MNRKQALVIFLIAVIVIAFIIAFMHQLWTSNWRQEYFFFQDPDFLISTMPNQRWKPQFWNYENGSSISITNGIAYLRYRQPDGTRWGNVNFLQGKEPHGGSNWASLLGGYTQELAEEISGVTFRRDFPIPRGKYLLKAKLKITEREWLSDVTDGEPKSNIGITLYCSFQRQGKEGIYLSDYDGDTTDMRAAVIDLFFASSFWNGSAFEPIKYSHLSFTAFGVDPTVVFTAENQLFELNAWKEVVFDLGDIISKAFDLLRELDIMAFTVHGAQFYVESSGVLIAAQFDYIKTELVSQSYFFFQDPDFLNDSRSLMKKWTEWTWKGQGQVSAGSFSNITNGVAWLKNVEDTGTSWSSSVVFQGRMPENWRVWGKLLGGKDLATAKPVEGVTFHRDFPIPKGKFFLETKVKLINRTYLASVSESVASAPKGDVGIALMCSFEYIGKDGKIHGSNYEAPDAGRIKAVHIDVLFSSFYWSGSTWIPIQYNNLFGTPYDLDYHISITVQNQITEVGVWKEITVDMAEIFSKTYDLISRYGWGTKDVISITVHGIQVYVDGIGISLEAQYDYIKTTVKP